MVRVSAAGLALVLATSAQASEERLAVLVGANLGAPDEPALHFAESDAARVHQTLLELGGVAPGRASLLAQPSPSEVLEALSVARGRAAELSAQGKKVTLFFYFSGHGDEASLHLGAERLALTALRARLSAIPAQARLIVLDSCRTTGRSKGVHRAPGFELSLDPSAQEGTVELRAGAPGEAAQESDELGGALFTHALLSAMRGAGDVDGDGRVTLFELYTQTYRDTLLRSGAALTAQRPSLQVDLEGSGEWVITQPGRAAATLRLGADQPGRALVFAVPSGAVMGELEPGVGRLALPPGRFLVQRRYGAELAVAQVDLPLGGARTLEARDFRPVSRAEWVAKGGHVELHPWRVEARIGVGTTPTGAERVMGRVEGGLWWALGSLELGLTVGYGRGRAETRGLSGDLDALEVSPRVGVRWLKASLAVGASLGLLVRQSWASLRGPDEQALDDAGLTSGRRFRYPTVGPRVDLQLTFFLRGGFSLGVGAGAALGLRPELAGDGAAAVVAARPELNLGVGVGHAF
ncbi:MAG: caspase family protein [Archangiaceae bacterium]|nr:caspase family protein [Archangiaceae bacterium]